MSATTAPVALRGHIELPHDQSTRTLWNRAGVTDAQRRRSAAADTVCRHGHSRIVKGQQLSSDTCSRMSQTPHTGASTRTFKGSQNEENSDPDSGNFGMHIGAGQRRRWPQRRVFEPGKQQFPQLLRFAQRWLVKQPLCSGLHPQRWHLCRPPPRHQSRRHKEQ